VSPRLSELLDDMKSGPLDDDEPTKSYFYGPDGAPRPAGYILKNPEYAATLRAIAKDGAKAMKKGPIAQNIIATIHAEPRAGELSLGDLSAYKPKKRNALCAPYREYKVCSGSPPSGGIGVLQALSLLESHPEIAKGPAEADALGLFIDASRLAYADRDYYVADPDFTPIPDLLNPNYVANRAARLKPSEKLPGAAPGNPAAFTGGDSLLGRWAGDKTKETPGTTHLSVVDSNGDAVSMTATIEGAFGSQRMTNGFMLNNELTDFARDLSADGRPYANAVGPRKRPRSSMSPTIIFNKSGEFYAATGSPGGMSIIAYTLKSIVAMIDWKMSPQEAAAFPNIIARAGGVRIETATMDAAAVATLRKRGYTITDSTGEGSGVHIVRAGATTLEGGADPRREGVAKGF
jgi:gamma-glutamyltranspeptidase/glutathione hydrolase